MTVAVVHDWLTGMRGGEKVLEALCELYPDAKDMRSARRSCSSVRSPTGTTVAICRCFPGPSSAFDSMAAI